MKKVKVAIAPFLRFCPSVVTLGVRPALSDYSREEIDLLLNAERIFFPTSRYVNLFHAAGKSLFPSYTTHRLQRSRIRQQILFQYLDLPCPRTRIYYGTSQKRQIVSDFNFPFRVMGPSAIYGESHEVLDLVGLQCYAQWYNPIVVQEYVEQTVKVRMIWVRCTCVGVLKLPFVAFSHGTEPMEIDDPFLSTAMGLSRSLVNRARLDDISIDWAFGNGRWQLLGLAPPPLRWSTTTETIHRHDHIASLIESKCF
jgi:ribosomal protein S6--L-glutamate ligase